MQSKESRLHCVLFYNLMHYHTSLDGYYYSHAVRRNTMNDNNRIIWIISIKNIFLIKPFFFVLTCRGFLMHFKWIERLGLFHDPLWPFDLQKIVTHIESRKIKFWIRKKYLEYLQDFYKLSLNCVIYYCRFYRSQHSNGK